MMTTISEDAARRLAGQLLAAMGANDRHAQIVTDHLVGANLAGHDSHGLVRLPQYQQQIASGQIRIDAEPLVVRETPTTALIDGQWIWGPVVATMAVELALAKAKSSSIACIGIRDCAHVGRVGVYPMQLAKEGLIAHSWCNGVGSARVAPWGGTQARLATNPIAVALPTSDKPIVVDITTSAVAEGKVRVARNANTPVPEGWILDGDGRPTTNPADLYDGGTILPLGGSLGYKGYALSIVVDVLAGVLTGAGCGLMPGVGNGNGMCLVAMDPAAFVAPDEFRRGVDAYLSYLRSTPRQDGVSEILIPGEPEERVADERRKTGIPIDDGTWRQLASLAAQLSVDIGSFRADATA